MSVLLFAENSNGTFKKAVYEAASYAKAVADKMGGAVEAVAIGDLSDEALNSLGKYGVSKVHRVSDDLLNTFNARAYAKVIADVAGAAGSKVVVMAQTYNGKSLSPRLSVRLNAAHLSGVTEVAEPNGEGFTVRRLVNSGKGIGTVQSHTAVNVMSVKVNSYGLKENPSSVSIADVSASISESDMGARGIEVVKTASKISITEAETVVSGGRGLKASENWGVLEELAEALGAGTACSKPVADMDWRPHHEHVGQTGIQIAPNLYIAMGISGAIQHLAGVNSSKNIVVINKDPEAPFYKIADYGIVADLFDVVPQLTEAVRKVKAGN